MQDRFEKDGAPIAVTRLDDMLVAYAGLPTSKFGKIARGFPKGSKVLRREFSRILIIPCSLPPHPLYSMSYYWILGFVCLT